MTNNILACKHLRIVYIRQYETCLRILFRVMQNQNALVTFSWEEFDRSKPAADMVQSLHEVYGSHALLSLSSLKPLIYKAGAGDPATFSPEENVIEFFRLWALHLERQQVAVFQYHSVKPEVYTFVLIPTTLAQEFVVSVDSLGAADLFERFLALPKSSEIDAAGSGGNSNGNSNPDKKSR